MDFCQQYYNHLDNLVKNREATYQQLSRARSPSRCQCQHQDTGVKNMKRIEVSDFEVYTKEIAVS